MSYYRTGTISLTNGSAAVVGAGTDWINGAAVGEALQAPDGNLYEILTISSATAMTLGQVYLGATASGQSYSIVPTQSYIRDLASQAATLVNSYSATNTTALKTSDADKATPVDADKLALRDSVTGLGRLLTWANLKATLAAWINGGTIPANFTAITGPHNGTVGATTPAAGSFTTVSATGAISSAGAAPYLSVTGQGGAFHAANKFGVDHYNGNARIYSSGPDASTNGGFEFHSTRSDGSNDFAPVTVDSSGNLLVGTTSGSNHVVYKNVDTGIVLLQLKDGNADNSGVHHTFSGGGVATYSAANACYKVGSDTTTNRSINATGSVNAAGADYAEYERNNGLTIAKGAIVGFKADGTLTDVFADAIRFAIKSTNPSYVGGDTWGSEDQVGRRPDEPQRIADKTEQQLVSAAIPAVAEVKDEDGEVITEALPVVEAVYETIITEAGDTDVEWAIKQADYATAKAAFEAALEAARQQVDRIAYSGKVPCNVLGATPGGYIIAVNDAGSIAGEFVADPDFSQYKKAVGRVNRILADGRCEVAVIIH